MRPTWVEISRSALEHNYNVLRAHAQRAGADLLCVIKADAYGHGITICGPVLAAAGAQWLGVTSVEEGVRLRRALNGDTGPVANEATEDLHSGVEHHDAHAASCATQDNLLPRVLVMGGAWKGEAEAIIEHGLTPVVWESYQLELLEQGARRMGLGLASLAVHVEVDTGMGRQGVSPNGLPALLQRLRTGGVLCLEGLHTHLASAEDHVTEKNMQQTTSFCRAALAARKEDLWPEYLAAGNSSTLAGIGAAAADGTLARLHEMARGVNAHLMLRPGIGLFGYLLQEKLQHGERTPALAAKLKPVMEWKTRVVALHNLGAGDTVGYGATWVAPGPRRVALLPVGYADGYARAMSWSNVSVTASEEPTGGEVLIRGRRAPVLGRVSMDLTVVDVTEIAGVEVGDEVALLGMQQDERVSAEELAHHRGTIAYEVLCGVGARVRRVSVE
jgi:alanine racemase